MLEAIRNPVREQSSLAIPRACSLPEHDDILQVISKQNLRRKGRRREDPSGCLSLEVMRSRVTVLEHGAPGPSGRGGARGRHGAAWGGLGQKAGGVE